MKLVETKPLRVVDTFAARELHKSRRYPSVNAFIEYGVRTGYCLGDAQKRRGKEMEI